MHIMPYIIALIAALCLMERSWRVTAAIILVSSVLSIFAVPLIDNSVLNENHYFIAGLWDSITAYLIIKFGKSGKYTQAGILALSIFVNALLLLEFRLVPSFFYSWYDEIIFGLNIIQATLFAGGIYGAITRLDDIRSVADRMVESDPPSNGGHTYSLNRSDKNILEDGQ